MRVIICLFILSITTNNAFASKEIYLQARNIANQIFGYELIKKIFGPEINMPKLPKIIKDGKSINFGNIVDPPKTKLNRKDRMNYDDRFLYELYQAVLETDPKEEEYQNWMNILGQDAKREGIYRAIIYDRKYGLLEESARNKLTDEAMNFTLFFYDKFINKKIKKDQLKSLNNYTIKRLVTEKALQMVDKLYEDNKENVYSWYAILSSDLAIKYKKLWDEKTRKNTSPLKHYNWAMMVGEQNIKSELIIKLNRVFNHLKKKVF